MGKKSDLSVRINPDPGAGSQIGSPGRMRDRGSSRGTRRGARAATGSGLSAWGLLD
ncbi:hypothetical protein [Lysobacter gummosus]|uniref:hypothetical protein n=1 Tax=Lysobacter gummosus TaxID=262324 RepID=UPI003624AF3C